MFGSVCLVAPPSGTIPQAHLLLMGLTSPVVYVELVELRTSTLIVHVHPYCARNPCHKVMPRQPSSVHAEEER